MSENKEGEALFISKSVFRLKTILVLLLLTLGSGVYAKTAAPIPIEKTPGWVIEKKVSVPQKVPLNDIDSGVYYLLADDQLKVDDTGKTASYAHFAELVVNQEGLEEVSQINVDYDPSYQKIVLNSLVIRRGGRSIDKTETATISILRRESGLEEQMYDGHLTANIIVDDVRVGDIVEYSYTRIGANPIYKGVFNYDRYVEWNMPVHYQGIRVLWGKPEPLHVKELNTDAVITEKKLGRFKAYSLELRDTPARHVDSQVPRWFQPYGIVYFHEAGSWSDIASWAAALYDNVIGGGEEIRQIAKRIEDNASTPEAKAVAALGYVQSNIRYLGIEMGTGSHAPSPAEETLKRRYGDCKDKAVLFISVLRALGIKAEPALVNTDIGRHVAEMPPMMNAFDHVIVKVVLGGKTYWLDPTRSHQIGKLENIYQPDYGYALVVDRKTRSLEPMKNTGHFSRTVINDVFDLTKGAGQDVLFESSTNYYGYAAEKHRFDLASESITNLQKQYLDFYSTYYPDIKVLMNFQSADDQKSGVVSQKEKYLIKNFWKKNDKDKAYTAEFYVNSFAFDLSKPEQLKRNAPYRLSHPIETEHTITVKLADADWSFPDEKSIVDNPYFSVKSDINYDGASRVLTLHYTYKSKTDHVPADGIDSYVKQSDKALDLLEYGIVKPYDVQAAQGAETGLGTTEAVILSAALLFLAGLLYSVISWRLDAKKQPPFPQALYYPVSPVKMLILSVMSFGIYTCYWFYKNYVYKKQEEGTAIMPFARALFCTFWYYPLYLALSKDSAERYRENRVLIRPLAVLFAVLFLAAGILANMDGVKSVAATIAFPLLLLPLVNYINHINREHPEAYAYYSRWRFRHTVLVLICLPLFLLAGAGEANLLPSDKIVKGDQLMAYDIHYMHRHDIFPAEEKPLYFYSDAFFTIRDDGNGFTDHYVFSYWRENGRLNVEKERFGNVSKIDVRYAGGAAENTIVKIVRNDGSSFILYLSAKDALDRVFVEKLRNRWDTAKAARTRLTSGGDGEPEFR